MNELMQKIAEKLSVNVDKTPEMYEALKGQYLVYEFYGYILGFMFVCLFVCFCFLLFTFLEICMDGYWDDYGLRFLIILVIFIMLIVVFILVVKYRNAHAPDIVFLKGILGGC